jgi:hypothetical protein
MAGVTRLAVDLGAEVTKIAVASGGPEPVVLTRQTATRSRREALAAALTLATCPGTPATPVTLAVPDHWLDGTAEGGRRQEDMRRIAEDELGLREVSWAGHLAAAAAVAASQREFAEPGAYLVCDIGGRGVRAAICEVTGQAVRQRAVRVATGGGWRDFDAAVRAVLGGGTAAGRATAKPAASGWTDPEQTIIREAISRHSGSSGPLGLAEDWHLAAMEQDRRARMVLDRAMGDPGFSDARAYTLGAFQEHELTAGQVIDCFGPTAQRVRECAEAVLDGGKPRVAVLTGGLAWLPLAVAVLRDVAGAEPVILGVDAAARGALLLASARDGGQADGPRTRLPPVSLPMNEVRDGVLAEASLPLPWTWSFGPEGDGPLLITEQRLTLDIDGRRITLPAPGLASGPYRIGLRPGWSGTGALVLRASPPCAGTVARDDVHVLPLEAKEAAQ